MKKALLILMFLVFTWLCWNHKSIQWIVQECYQNRATSFKVFQNFPGGTDIAICQSNPTTYAAITVVGVRGWEELINPFSRN